MQLVHAACWTENLEEAVSFWREYLGANAGDIYHSARRAGFRSCFIALPEGGAQIELMSGPWVQERKPEDHQGWDHIALSVGSQADVDALAQRCRDAGYLIAEPRLTGDGYYEAIIRTPDGIPIEIVASRSGVFAGV
jgi:lactoylglutathione lyase